MIDSFVMKSKVKLSVYSVIVTLVVIIAFAIGIISLWSMKMEWFLFVFLFLGLICSSMFYFPISIESDHSSLKIHRLLKTKVLAYSDIAKAERCYPSSGGLRLLGSGGFMGYWGYFSDIIIGTYFGYFGDKNQCIQIKLKDGKQYVISCENPDKMLKCITGRIDQRISS